MGVRDVLCIWTTRSSTESKRTMPRIRVDEGHLDLDAVQLEVVAVQHVGLHAALPLARRTSGWCRR